MNSKIAKALGATPVTMAELVEILKNTNRGATFCGIVAETEPKMNKTGNPYYGRVKKTNRLSGILNFNYDEGVRRRLEKEGKNPDSFDGGTSWHRPVIVDGKATPLSTHKDHTDKYYLRFAEQSAETPEFTCDGMPIEKDVIAPYLPTPRKYENQGLSNPLKILCYSLDSIKQMTLNSKSYVVI